MKVNNSSMKKPINRSKTQKFYMLFRKELTQTKKEMNLKKITYRGFGRFDILKNFSQFLITGSTFEVSMAIYRQIQTSSSHSSLCVFFIAARSHYIFLSPSTTAVKYALALSLSQKEACFEQQWLLQTSL